MRTSRWTPLPLLIGLLTLSPVTAGAQSAVSGTEIKIGGIFDLSSDAGRIWGTAEKNGFLMAIRDFEAVHPGFRINYKIEDSGYSNSQSITAFKKLTSVDKINYIVGPTWEMFVATMPLCERERKVCVAPSNNSREFENPNLRFSFTAYFPEDGYSDVIAEEVNKRGYVQPVIIANTSAYADPQVENILAFLKNKPRAHRVLPGDMDFRTLITQLPQSTDALIVFLANDGQGAAFYKQLAELGRSSLPIFTDDSPIFDRALPELRALRLTLYYSQQFFPPDVKERWDRRYQKVYGEPSPAPSASVSYDETMILLECISKEADTIAVSRCISRTDGWAGSSGTITFGGRSSVGTRKFELKKLE